MAARRPHPDPYQPRRRRDPGPGESPPETLDADESPMAWWEWPFVVVLAPLRWAGRAVTAGVDAIGDLLDGVARVLGQAYELVVLHPLRALLGMLARPVRWLGRAASVLLRTPAALLTGIGRWVGRGVTALAQTLAAALSWVFRPVALLAGLGLVPVRFVAQALARWWEAAGRWGALVWRTVTWPVRSLAREARELVDVPLRRLARRLGRLRAAVRNRTSRLRRARSGTEPYPSIASSSSRPSSPSGETSRSARTS